MGVLSLRGVIGACVQVKFVEATVVVRLPYLCWRKAVAIGYKPEPHAKTS